MKSPKTHKDVQEQMSEFLPVSVINKISFYLIPISYKHKNFIMFTKTILYSISLACIYRSGKNEGKNVLS